jgi:uncharacterized protein YceK
MYRFYGGVRKDVEEAASAFVGTESQPAAAAAQPCTTAVGLAYLAIDLPLSALGDTVLLPFMLPEIMQQTNSTSHSTDGNSQ